VIEEKVTVIAEGETSTPAQRILERAIEVINAAGEVAGSRPVPARTGEEARK
jgi:hypothetical protein